MPFETQDWYENIHTISLIMRNNYTRGSSEVVGVFAGASNRLKPYLTNENNMTVVHTAGNNTNIADAVKKMYSSALEYCSEYPDRRGPIVTIFHNHARGTIFTRKDILTFICYPFIVEAFVDADKIYVIRKQGDIISFYNNRELIKRAQEIFIRVQTEHTKSEEYIRKYTQILQDLNNTNRAEEREACKNLIREFQLNELKKILAVFSAKLGEECNVAIQFYLTDVPELKNKKLCKLIL